MNVDEIALLAPAKVDADNRHSILGDYVYI
jgi:hypothetical protein